MSNGSRWKQPSVKSVRLLGFFLNLLKCTGIGEIESKESGLTFANLYAEAEPSLPVISWVLFYQLIMSTPLWKTVRLHGKKVQNATNNLFTFPNNFINRIGKCKLRTSILLLIDKSSLKYGFCKKFRVSVQGVKSLGGHFACLCRGLNFMK